MLAVSLVGFTSCSKFDDSSLWDKINGLDAQQKIMAEKLALLEALNDKLFIEKMDETETGWVLTMSDGTEITLTNGVNGAPGADGKPGSNLAIESVTTSSKTIEIDLPDMEESPSWFIYSAKWEQNMGEIRLGALNGREALAIYGANMDGDINSTPMYTIPTFGNDLTKPYFIFDQVTFKYNDGSSITFDVAAKSSDTPYGTVTNVMTEGFSAAAGTLTLVKNGSVEGPTIDGVKYNVVKIGNRYWTVENLRTTVLNDGTPIATALSTNAWKASTDPACCISGPNGEWAGEGEMNANAPDNAYRPIVGLLYNWYAASNPKIAPEGWHVATKADFDDLMAVATHEQLKSTTLLPIIGGWESKFEVGTNDFGFNGLCCNYLEYHGTFSKFSSEMLLWSSDETQDLEEPEGVMAGLLYRGGNLTFFPQRCGAPIRLVKDVK